MRTPPPVLPDEESAAASHHARSRSRGADAGLDMRLAGSMGLIFVLVFGLALLLLDRMYGIHGARAMAIATVAAVMLTAASAYFIQGVGDAVAAVAQKAVMPSGRSTPYEEQFSYQEALAARGDVVAALESYEAVIAEKPTVALPRVRAAELYAKGNRDPRRAAELFREVRDLAGVSTRDALYASNRLVDLYDGPLDEPGRALVELRRIVERFPNSRDAERSRDAIVRLKRRLHGERGER